MPALFVCRWRVCTAQGRGVPGAGILSYTTRGSRRCGRSSSPKLGTPGCAACTVCHRRFECSTFAEADKGRNARAIFHVPLLYTKAAAAAAGSGGALSLPSAHACMRQRFRACAAVCGCFGPHVLLFALTQLCPLVFFNILPLYCESGLPKGKKKENSGTCCYLPEGN